MHFCLAFLAGALFFCSLCFAFVFFSPGSLIALDIWISKLRMFPFQSQNPQMQSQAPMQAQQSQQCNGVFLSPTSSPFDIPFVKACSARTEETTILAACEGLLQLKNPAFPELAMKLLRVLNSRSASVVDQFVREHPAFFPTGALPDRPSYPGPDTNITSPEVDPAVPFVDLVLSVCSSYLMCTNPVMPRLAVTYLRSLNTVVPDLVIDFTHKNPAVIHLGRDCYESLIKIQPWW